MANKNKSKFKEKLREMFPLMSALSDMQKEMKNEAKENTIKAFDKVKDAAIKVQADITKKLSDVGAGLIGKIPAILASKSEVTNVPKITTNDESWYGGESMKSNYTRLASVKITNANPKYHMMDVLHISLDPKEFIDTTIFTTLIEDTISNYDASMGTASGLTATAILNVLKAAATVYTLAKIMQRGCNASEYSIYNGYNAATNAPEVIKAKNVLTAGVGSGSTNFCSFTGTFNDSTTSWLPMYPPYVPTISNSVWAKDVVTECIKLFLPETIKKIIDYYFDGIFCSNPVDGNNGYVVFWPVGVMSPTGAANLQTSLSAAITNYNTAITANSYLNNFMSSIGFIKPIQPVDLQRTPTADQLIIHVDEGLSVAINNMQSWVSSTYYGQRYDQGNDRLMVLSPEADLTPDFDSTEVLHTGISIGKIGEALRLWLMKGNLMACSGIRKVQHATYNNAFRYCVSGDYYPKVKALTYTGSFALTESVQNKLLTSLTTIMVKPAEPFSAVGLTNTSDKPEALTITKTSTVNYNIGNSTGTSLTDVNVDMGSDGYLLTNCSTVFDYIKAAVTFSDNVIDTMKKAKARWATDNTYSKIS